MNLQKYLITGATGFIGSALVARLLSQEHVAPENIYLLLRKKPDSQKSLLAERLKRLGVDAEQVFAKFHFVESDFEDASVFKVSLQTLANTLTAETFVCAHLAAIIKSNGDEIKQERLNLGVTQDLLDFCGQHRAKHFVYMSSVAAFGLALKSGSRTEKDFENFSFLSTGMPYFHTKRLAHLTVLQGASIPCTLLCPSVVHGALENEKNSRSHLRLLEQGKLSWAPGGIFNIVSLDRTIDETVQALQTANPQGVHTRLVVEQNVLPKQYFTAYAKLFGQSQNFKVLPTTLTHLLFAWVWVLARLGFKVHGILEGIVAGSGYMEFQSETPYHRPDRSMETILRDIS